MKDAQSIEMVGNDNVVKVITNNAKNYKGANALVKARYEHFFGHHTPYTPSTW